MNTSSFLGVTFHFEDPIPCAVSLVCALVPSFALYHFGKRSYRDLKINRYDTSSPGSPVAHVMRLLAQVAIVSLLFISMALYIFQLHSRDQADLLYAPYLIFLGVSALNWIVGLVLYTMEHQKLGDISANLRNFWIVSFFAQDIGIVLTEWLILHENNFGAFEVVNIAYIVVLTLLIIHSALTKRHLALDTSQKLSVVYVPYKDLRTRANSYKSPSFGMDNEHLESSADLMNKFLTFSQKQKGRASTVTDISTGPSLVAEKKEERILQQESLAKPLLENAEEKSSSLPEEIIIQRPKSDSEPPQPKKKKEEPLYEDIYIQSYINLEKQGKSTIVYVVKYQKDGKVMTTRRSYSEFYKLYQKTQKHYPKVILPCFPEKKTKSESSESKTLDERKDQLTLVMKKISEKRLQTTHLDDFLKSDEVLPSFSSRGSVFLSVTDNQKDQIIPMDHSIGDNPTIEEVDEVDLEPLKTVHQKEIPTMGSFADSNFCIRVDQNLPLSKDSISPKSLRESEQRVQQVSPTSGLTESISIPNQIVGETIITNYTNYKPGRKLSDEDNAFKVEIVGAWNDQRNGDTATYYEFQIKDLLKDKIYATSKRYSDFKDLHNKMKDYAKKIKTSLPIELPNRGTMGPMVRKTDPMLIEYRKFALPNYLQTLLNKKNFHDCSILLDFAEIK